MRCKVIWFVIIKVFIYGDVLSNCVDVLIFDK